MNRIHLDIYDKYIFRTVINEHLFVDKYLI